MEGRINRLARGLDPELFSISIITLRPNPNRQLQLPSHVKISHFDIPSGIHFGKLIKLSNYIRKEKFLLVHSHNWATMFYGVLAGRLAVKPYVFHGEHGINFEDTLGISSKRLMLQKILAALCHRIVAVNSAMEEYLKSNWKCGNKVVSIMNGVDLQRFQPADAPRHPLVFGFMGRLDKVKNIPCILLAGKILMDKGYYPEDFRILIGGNGPEKELLDKLVMEHGLEKVVEFLGDCQEPEKEYLKFSVFINSSFSEGMSNTLLEAMAVGLALIWANNEGNKSWLSNGKDGLEFENDDSTGLAEKMEYFITHKEEISSFGIANRKRAESDFDNMNFINNYKREYLGLFRNVN